MYMYYISFVRITLLLISKTLKIKTKQKKVVYMNDKMLCETIPFILIKSTRFHVCSMHKCAYVVSGEDRICYH